METFHRHEKQIPLPQGGIGMTSLVLTQSRARDDGRNFCILGQALMVGLLPRRTTRSSQRKRADKGTPFFFDRPIDP